MKKFVPYLRQHWRLVAMTVIVLAVIWFLLLFRLGSLVGGVASSEVSQRSFADSWRHIITNPLNAPLTVLQWLCLTIFSHQGQTVIRLASSLIGFVAVAIFAFVVRSWYGLKTAVLSTVLFMFSAWFLHVSRFAGPDVLYLWAVPTLLATHIIWERYGTKLVVQYLVVVLLALLLYVPGMIWFILVSLGLQTQRLGEAWQIVRTWQQRALAAGIKLVILVPLLIAIVRNGSIARTWLGLPHNFHSAGSFGRGLLHSLSFFIWRGPATPSLWLDRLPILDFFSSVMFILGCIFYIRHAAAPRSRLLAGLFITGALLVTVGGPVTSSSLVPIAYVIVAAGMGFLLREWLRFFPRNPLARGLGIGLLGLVVFIACVYNSRAYFIAWPHNQATKAAFRTRL